MLLFHCKQEKKEVNEFNGIYLLIYSLLSLKNQQTLGVSDSTITKKTSVGWKATRPGNLFQDTSWAYKPGRNLARISILKVMQMLALHNINIR